MSTTHVGDPTGIVARQAVDITIPVDGDALTAASSNVGANHLADILKYVMNHAGLIDVASQWSALQTWTTKVIFRGAGVDTTPVIQTDAHPNDEFKLIWEIGTATKVRLYVSSTMQFVCTHNASYTHAGTIWTADNTGTEAQALVMGSGQGFAFLQKGVTTVAWLDNAWDKSVSSYAGALFADSIDTATGGGDLSVGAVLDMHGSTGATGKNKLCADNVVKAFAYINTGATPTTSMQFGVTAAPALSPTPNLIRITLDQPMSSSLYPIVASSNGTYSVGTVIINSTTFDIAAYNVTAAGAVVNLQSTNIQISFAVHGTQ